MTSSSRARQSSMPQRRRSRMGRTASPTWSPTRPASPARSAAGASRQIDPEHFSVKDKPQYQRASGGLEYENVFALGAMVGVDDIDAVTFANFVCNEDGMDTICFGGSLAAAMELYEEGVITKKQTGGIRPVLRLRRSAGRRWPSRPPRARASAGRDRPGRQAADARSTAGPNLPWWSRARSSPATTRARCRAWRSPTPPRTGAPVICAPVRSCPISRPPSWRARSRSCGQARTSARPPSIRPGFAPSSAAPSRPTRSPPCSPATLAGDWTAERIRETGERIWNLERLSTSRPGLGRADDTLPHRMLKEPAKSGTAKGMVASWATCCRTITSSAAGTRRACRAARR